ncbi:MAG: c-type cytochrome [Verrucomicrobia bacterium]|nr:c-type cytochrome [Verrucomicrobiota bacterium]
MRLRKLLLVVPCLGLALLSPAHGAEFTAKDRQPTPEELKTLSPVASPEKAAELRKDVEFPDSFDVSIFATPPAVNYPVFVGAAPDGTLYVSSDGNGSLDRKPHLGRVLRVRDTNHDGQADEVRAFVPDVDSPRGLVWDHDRLYLLHPPDISVFYDRDGDGVAEDRKTLVSGIAFTFKDRPADHSSNGLELGIDGWLYAAIGDFGFMEATGTDGRKLQLRGGGVVRLRPDGSEMELFADGTRNILEVAVSPLLDGFSRDNTNDGGGWDIRLHHFSGYTQHGYPRLFKNFPDEIIQPLADYGGGSGCGAAWIDEPGIPTTWNNAPFTADWGTEWIYHHGLTEKGGTFTATQEKFAKLPRVTDLDVDANSAIYAASWKGASFTWVGPDVGFIARATPKGFKPDALPDFERLDDASLVKLLESPSHRRRLEASRTLLRRPAPELAPGTPANALVQLASDTSRPIAVRVAALFTLKQWLGTRATPALAKLITDDSIGAWALRAVTDRTGELTGVPTAPILGALKSSNARIRRDAAIAVGRLGKSDLAPSLTPLLADSDPIVAHSSAHSLVGLRASAACLAVIDDPEAPTGRRAGALRVLQSLHSPEVVGALLDRLAREKDAERRAGLLTALCRLYFQEGVWKGDSWGTRPDTRGPFYQPESWSETPRIAAALKATLTQANSAEAAHLGRELSRHRIPAGEALDTLISRAANDPVLLPAIAAQLAEADSIPAAAVPLLAQTATAPNTPDAARAQALIALTKSPSPAAWQAILSSYSRVQQTKTENNLAEKARNAVANAAVLDQAHEVFEQRAAQLDGEPALLAEGILLKLASRKVGSPEARDAATKSLDAGWAIPARRVQILKAAAQVRDSSRAAQFVAALNDSNPQVAAAAQETIKRLKIDPEKFRAEAQSPRVGDLSVDAVLTSVVSTKGEVSRGEQLFAQVGCNGCHTVKAGEPLKGPFLGTIAQTYRRPALAEAILLPNKTLAQGFVANHFELKDGTELDGFVVQEAADAVTIRTITAQEQVIPVAQITKREKQERSLMPEGLTSALTVQELASLLDYLEALSQAK